MSDQDADTSQSKLGKKDQISSLGVRIGDVAAMLRVMDPLQGTGPNPESRRQLLADLCRFIGVKVGAVDPQTIEADGSGQPNSANTAQQPGELTNQPPEHSELSPRQEQTLRHLLDGDSEKQVARKLDISQHTVHVYVKALYRRFGVSTRAELLSRYLKR